VFAETHGAQPREGAAGTGGTNQIPALWQKGEQGRERPSVRPISAGRQQEFVTIDPDTLVSKSFVCQELSQGRQAGHAPCVGDTGQYRSRVSAELSMFHGTPKDNRLVMEKRLGSCSEQTVTPRLRPKQNRTLGRSY